MAKERRMETIHIRKKGPACRRQRKLVEEEYTGKRIGSTTGGTGGKRRERKAPTYVE